MGLRQLRSWIVRLAGIFNKRARDRELADEIDSHLQMHIEDNLRSGMTAEEARVRALIRLGGVEQVKEQYRTRRGLPMIEVLVQNLRFGLRILLKNPGFTFVAVITLALGIGANTAIFSVIYGVLIDPYPYANAQGIWAPQIRSLKSPNGRGSYLMGEYLEAARLAPFSDVMATGFDNVLMTGDRAPESFQGVLLSGNAFNFLGVQPVLGRTIQPSDIQPSGDAEPVVVLSYITWQRLFDSDPGAIGKTLRLNDQPHTVIGVMPPRFGWYGSDTIWLPMPVSNQEKRRVNPIMRLKPGVSKETAEAQLHALHLRLAQEKPENFPKDGFKTVLMNYLDITVASGDMKSSLQLLFFTVGFLLLIACANVANLQLSRSTTRAREIAVRLAIGASRGRILWQLLTESILLSFVGGALGILIAVAVTKAMVLVMPSSYVPNEARVTVNGWVLLFTVAISVVTGVLSGLLPALRCSRPDLADALKDAARGLGAGLASRRTRNILVIAEVALSVILLVGAGLITRSFMALNRVDSGLSAEQVLFVGMPLPPKRYKTIEQRNEFARDLVERVRHLPGIQDVSIGNGGMPYWWTTSNYSIEGQNHDASQNIVINLVSPDYLQTVGIPLRSGRGFTEQEVAKGDHVVLINESAMRLWPDGVSPLGRSLRIDVLEQQSGSNTLTPAGSLPVVTVVGVVGDTKNDGLQNRTRPAAYLPYTLLAPSQRVLAVRAHTEPLLLVNTIREQVNAIDRDQPLGRAITLEQVFGDETVQPRFNMLLFGSFALLGLVLAVIGIYSVLSYHVMHRTHEIGVRMALGAQRWDVLRLMLRMGAKLVSVGLVIGVIASLMLTRFLQNMLFQIGTWDPVAILAVVILLGAAAFFACYIPARRAAKVDPMTALRYE